MHHFIANNDWLFPATASNGLMYIFREIKLEIQSHYDFDDEIVWTLEDDGHFTLKYAYRMVKISQVQTIQWPSFLWFPRCIKKHSIYAWMFLWGKLNIKNFLLKRNLDCDSYCVLCPCTWEIGAHLMLHCTYSQMVWTSLLAKLNPTFVSCDSPLD